MRFLDSAKIFFALGALLAAGCAAPFAARKGELLPLAENIPHKAAAEAFGNKVMIAADGEASARAGARMNELGGNAIDSAVAASFAISVERPHSTGLGGGGFFLLHLARQGKTLAFDFRERAPMRAHRDMYLKDGQPVPDLSLNGPLAAGTPGLVAGLVEVHRRHGRLPLATVLEPAIDLAEKGFPVYRALAEAIANRRDVLAAYPSSRKIFLHEGGSPLAQGDLLVQKDLGKTLRRIAKSGRAGFYKGPVAVAIVTENQKAGGLIGHRDLDAYEVKLREPVRGSFLGHEIVSMPPPSSGGAHVIGILNMVEKDPLAAQGPASPETVHVLASAMQRAFADRAEYLGDTDFVKVPLKGLTSKEYAASLRRGFGESATPSSIVKAGIPPGAEPEHTTHLTVMDSQGNAVSTTQTINGWFGSGFVVEGTGVLLNNEMDDFSIKPGVANLFGAIGNDKNAVAPGKRPLSSMSPTIVFRGGKPWLALGSPSGTRIITCVASTILNRVAFGLPLYDAVARVRYHHQWQPDEIRVDLPGFPPSLASALERKGYTLNVSNLGCRVAAVELENGLLHGVADPRGEGLSLGE